MRTRPPPQITTTRLGRGVRRARKRADAAHLLALLGVPDRGPRARPHATPAPEAHRQRGRGGVRTRCRDDAPRQARRAARHVCPLGGATPQAQPARRRCRLCALSPVALHTTHDSVACPVATCRRQRRAGAPAVRSGAEGVPAPADEEQEEGEPARAGTAQFFAGWLSPSATAFDPTHTNS